MNPQSAQSEMNWWALSDITKVEMPYRAANHRNERRNSAAVVSATSSICRALVTMPENRHTYAFLLLSRCLMNTGPK